MWFLPQPLAQSQGWLDYFIHSIDTKRFISPWPLGPCALGSHTTKPPAKGQSSQRKWLFFWTQMPWAPEIQQDNTSHLGKLHLLWLSALKWGQPCGSELHPTRAPTNRRTLSYETYFESSLFAWNLANWILKVDPTQPAWLGSVRSSSFLGNSLF